MRTIKVLLMSVVSSQNGATGNFWVPSIEVWDVKNGQLNVMTRLYVDEASYIAGLSPIETKYFKKIVTDWESKDIENYAFDFIKAESYFSTATESTVTI